MPQSLATALMERLALFDRRRRRQRVVVALSLAIALLSCWIAGWALVDRLCDLPRAARVVLSLAGLIAAMRLIGPALRGAWRRGVDWRGAAAGIEARAALEHRLSTVVSQSLAPLRHRGSRDMLDRIAAEAELALAPLSTASLLPARRLARPVAAAAAGAALVAALFIWPWLDLPALAMRQITPWADLPAVTTTRLIVDGGDMAIAPGGKLRIAVDARRLGGAVPRVQIDGADGPIATALMTPVGNGRFVHQGVAPARDASYRIVANDAATHWFAIHIARPPVRLATRARYSYPDYLQRPPLEAEAPGGALEAPAGTVAAVRIVADQPLADASVVVDGDAEATAPTADPATRVWTHRIDADGDYVVRMRAADGAAADSPRATIRALADRAPVVWIGRPDGDRSAGARDMLIVECGAMDDHAVASMALSLGINANPPRDLPLRIAPGRTSECRVAVDLAAERVVAGDWVTLGATATDSAGRTAVAAARHILISAHPIDASLAAAVDALATARASAGVLRDALTTAATAYPADPDAADRALTRAIEIAPRLVNDLLRASRFLARDDQSRGLARAVDDARLAAVALADADAILRRGDSRADIGGPLAGAVGRLSSISATLDALAGGRTAAMLLAERANGVEGSTTAPSDAISIAIARLRQADRAAFADAALRLGLRADDPALPEALERLIEAESNHLSHIDEVDFADAAAQWVDAPATGAALVGRLAAASRLRALQASPDPRYAADLLLMSRAVDRLGEGIATPRDDPRARGALPEAIVAIRRWRIGATIKPPPPDADAMAGDADRARRRLAEWAQLDPAIANAVPAAPSDAAAADADVARANAALAGRDYAAVEALDARLRRSDDILDPLFVRATRQARTIDRIAEAQRGIAAETRDSNPFALPDLVRRQSAVAADIGAVTEDVSGPGAAVPDARQTALEAVQYAQERLAAMPQRLALALTAAEDRAGVAEQAAGAARAAAEAASRHDPVAAVAGRIAAQAGRLLDEADRRLASESRGVHADVADAIRAAIAPFAPETVAAVAAIDTELLPASRVLAQSLTADDRRIRAEAAAAMRRAIEAVQSRLREARVELIQRDPLVAAKWFAATAAALLDGAPADLDGAIARQGAVNDALDDAWRDRVAVANDDRLGRAPGLGAIVAKPASSAVLADHPAYHPADSDSPWTEGMRSPMDPSGPFAAPPPPEYRAAIDAYFEAIRIGSPRAKESP